ncbi:hypothetical protein ACIQ9P_19825 [Kitasatospora sp. NPDC094019]|uniref:hypothetical protein n=1 Tax=Kitasatospora sp. NPDC094019 TaxID=3364091 RepID=UPI0037FA6F65
MDPELAFDGIEQPDGTGTGTGTGAQRPTLAELAGRDAGELTDALQPALSEAGGTAVAAFNSAL